MEILEITSLYYLAHDNIPILGFLGKDVRLFLYFQVSDTNLAWFCLWGNRKDDYWANMLKLTSTLLTK
jgi:hypothetical protein